MTPPHHFLDSERFKTTQKTPTNPSRYANLNKIGASWHVLKSLDKHINPGATEAYQKGVAPSGGNSLLSSATFNCPSNMPLLHDHTLIMCKPPIRADPRSVLPSIRMMGVLGSSPILPTRYRIHCYRCKHPLRQRMIALRGQLRL